MISGSHSTIAIYESLSYGYQNDTACLLSRLVDLEDRLIAVIDAKLDPDKKAIVLVGAGVLLGFSFFNAVLIEPIHIQVERQRDDAGNFCVGFPFNEYCDNKLPSSNNCSAAIIATWCECQQVVNSIPTAIVYCSCMFAIAMLLFLLGLSRSGQYFMNRKYINSADPRFDNLLLQDLRKMEAELDLSIDYSRPLDALKVITSKKKEFRLLLANKNPSVALESIASETGIVALKDPKIREHILQYVDISYTAKSMTLRQDVLRFFKAIQCKSSRRKEPELVQITTPLLKTAR